MKPIAHLLLCLLLAACASASQPSKPSSPDLLDQLADHDRFVARLPARFLLLTAPGKASSVEKWRARLPPEKEAQPVVLSGPVGKKLVRATRAPRLSRSMIRDGVSAKVELLLLVNGRGDVADICILNRKDAPADVITAAIVACKDWKFDPLVLESGMSGIVVYQTIEINVPGR